MELSVNKQIEEMLLVATEFHRGQTRFDGTPYILHPIRVMYDVHNPVSKIIALGHDLIEDTPCTAEYLLERGFSSVAVEGIVILTHERSIDYFDYINNIIASPLAELVVPVKLKDIADNMRITQIPDLKDKDLKRIKKYHLARRMLKGD